MSKLLTYLKPYKLLYIKATLYSVFNKIFDIMPEILIGIAVDAIVKRQDSWVGQQSGLPVMQQLSLIGLATFVIWILESATEFKAAIGWRKLGQIVQHNLRIQIYTHIQKLPLSFFETRKTGSLISILNDDINQLERFVEHGVNDIIQVAVSTVVIGVIFFVVSPLLAACAILPIPLIISGSFYFQRRLASSFMAVRDKASNISSRLANNILGIFTIKCFNTEEFEAENLQKDSTDYRLTNEKAIFVSSIIAPIIRMAVLLGFLLTLIYGGYLTIINEIAIGSYSLLVFLTQRLLWPLTRLADTTVNYQKSMIAAARALSLMNEQVFEENTQKFDHSKPQKYLIEAKNLCFNYDNMCEVLHDIQFQIPFGKLIAFVGNTGSGKSTIVKLLTGVYQATRGSIAIDGIEISKIDRSELCKIMSIVNQEVYIFQGTIAHNISYGLSTDLDLIIAAAKLAQLHDYIIKLPHQYEHLLTERGQNLSGGQKQRLAIARAILRNPKILILDEATSAVDNETEYEIQKAIKLLAKDRTIISVAHRLSAVRAADHIFVLDNGAIIEQGTHDELLALSKTYHRLWKIQTGE